MSITQDLVLDLKLDKIVDSKVSDSSGKGNHGSVSEHSIIGYEHDKARYYLSGSNNNKGYISLPKLVTQDKGTIQFWVKLPSKPSGENNDIYFSCSKKTGNNTKYFTISIVDQTLRFYFKDTKNKNSGASYNPVIPDQWYHVTVVWRYNQAPLAQLYLNGVLKAENEEALGPRPDLNPIKININKGSLMSRIRIYHKALSENEIKENLYADQASPLLSITQNNLTLAVDLFKQGYTSWQDIVMDTQAAFATKVSDIFANNQDLADETYQRAQVLKRLQVITQGNHLLSVQLMDSGIHSHVDILSLSRQNFVDQYKDTLFQGSETTALQIYQQVLLKQKITKNRKVAELDTVFRVV